MPHPKPFAFNVIVLCVFFKRWSNFSSEFILLLLGSSTQFALLEVWIFLCCCRSCILKKSHLEDWIFILFFFVNGCDEIHVFLLNFDATVLFSCPTETPLNSSFQVTLACRGCYECTNSSTCHRIYNIA